MGLEWEAVGAVLLERERRPVVVLDRSGRIARTNNALRLFLEEGACTRASPLVEDWLLPESRLAFHEAWARVLAGERPRVSVALLPTASLLEPVFELVPLPRDGMVASVMMVMIDAVAPSPALPLVPTRGSLYEVSIDGEGRPERLLRAVSAERQPRLDRSAPCFRALHGRDRPCECCPLSSPQRDGVHSAVRVDSHSPFRAQLLSARRVREDLATVSAVPIDETIYGELVESRIEALATKGKLTERERHVLSLLLMGCSLEDIANTEGISARTAKYHLQNVLRKVGAESRTDLFRLLR